MVLFPAPAGPSIAILNPICYFPPILHYFDNCETLLNGEQVVYLNGENVNAYIRTEEVGRMASVSSPNPRVRKKLTQLQQKLAAEEDVVMDGRDIGTCVLPDAQVKVYLTADSSASARESITRTPRLCRSSTTSSLCMIGPNV